MLVLSRKVEESILLGSDIKITVLGVNGDKVRIGVDAPRTVKILRGETLEQARAENRMSAEMSADVAAMLQEAQNTKEK